MADRMRVTSVMLGSLPRGERLVLLGGGAGDLRASVFSPEVTKSESPARGGPARRGTLAKGMRPARATYDEPRTSAPGSRSGARCRLCGVREGKMTRDKRSRSRKSCLKAHLT